MVRLGSESGQGELQELSLVHCIALPSHLLLSVVAALNRADEYPTQEVRIEGLQHHASGEPFSGFGGAVQASRVATVGSESEGRGI